MSFVKPSMMCDARMMILIVKSITMGDLRMMILIVKPSTTVDVCISFSFMLMN